MALLDMLKMIKISSSMILLLLAFSMISSAEAAAIGKLIITETSPENALKQMGTNAATRASKTVEDTAAESEKAEKVKIADLIAEKIAKLKAEQIEKIEEKIKQAKEEKIKIAKEAKEEALSSKPSKTNPDGDLIPTDDASE